MSPMRQFNADLDQNDVVQSNIGNGIVAASPLLTKNALLTQASATRIGVRSGHKRSELPG